MGIRDHSTNSYDVWDQISKYYLSAFTELDYYRMEVISVLEPTPYEMDFVESIHSPTGRRPCNVPPIVIEKISMDHGMDHGGGDETINVQVEDNIEHVDTTPHPDVSMSSSSITLDHNV
ncbi:hypothetical protein FNV43_RR04245 [Rhamnella rubrinervis]|uniref:Uncharacterized protein n=1 Tax=Rhamnella rubrinervis TaxID=2594499 RepID=A0A8K0HKC0_9ROSA|nr:hypothetical protein FNV43_RR04245 [Rhamnella rubrinervis]